MISRRIAALLLGALALGGCATGTIALPDVADGAAGGAESTAAVTHADLAPPAATTGLATMTVAQLPPQGVQTLELIRDGGPYPYAKDGSTFQNRERILPSRTSGFYAEYTVPTPGEDDRGARRIVAGDDGSRFYTADHYNSFREVVSG